MHSDREEPGKSLEQSIAPQNAREDHERWDEGRRNPPPPVSSRSLEALVHSLYCMADRAAEAGLHGNVGIARRAAGLIDNVQKAVTRLLPEGQGVRHASVEVDLAVVSLQARESGRIMAILTDPAGGGWWSLPVDELVPIYDIVAEDLTSWREIGPDPLRSLEPRSLGVVIDERELRGDDLIYQGEGTWNLRDGSGGGGNYPPPDPSNDLPVGTVRRGVHHLSVNPDQEVHVYHPAFGQAAETVGAARDDRRVYEDALPVRFLFGLLIVVIVIALLLMATR